MIMHARWLAFAPMALAVGLAVPGAPQAATCQQTKLAAAGKATAGTLHCHAAAAKLATVAAPACLDKSATKLAETFTKADAKGGCPTTGDATGVQVAVDACVGLVRSTLGAVSPPPAPSPCLQAKLDAAGKSVSARLKCWAKAAAKATAVDPLCLSKEEAKLLAAFGKADLKAACVQSGDASVAEGAVSTCVANVLGLLPPPTTTTTSMSTTTTTLAGPCGGSEPPVLSGITALHNDVRAAASPTPVPPLAPLCWSASAAAVAQGWADTCTWAHNAGRGALGENLYAFAGVGSATDAVAAWASEAVEYDYTTNTCAGLCGHYTQIVWRSTQAVGCGTKACSTGSPFGASFPNWTIVVCNYDPPGNYLGQWPY